MKEFKDLKIAVAGTGYVGLSLAVLLAQHHQVTALDIVPEKVEMINNKKSPIRDEYIEKYLAEKELDLTATLEPYQADGDEADYNQTYQDMGDILTECYSGETEAGETFIYAANEDGTFCSVLVIDQDDNYVSFVGEGTFDEENGTVTITDEVSEMALTFGVAVNDDDTLTLDMGDLGSATVQEATLAVAVQGLKYAVENGTEMN